MTNQLQRQPPHSTRHARSPPRTAADARAASQAADPENASEDATPDQLLDACPFPSQPLPPGLLRRPHEFAQYTSAEFTNLLAENGMVQSLSRPRQCWDNAVAESWFASFKLELIDGRSWPTSKQLRLAVFDYIEVFYNRQRLHSALNYLSPARYEAKIHQTTATQAA